MATTATSSLSGASLAALFDELEKIAEEAQPSKADIAKRWLRNTALIATGAGVGGAVTTVADKLIDRHAVPLLRRLSPTAQRMILAPAGPALAIATYVAAQKLLEEKGKK